MSAERELLTVKEFAEREGVSRQAVYQRLDKSLKAFKVSLDSGIYIDYTAYLCDKQQSEQGDSCQGVSREVDKACQGVSSPDLDSLTARISELEAALDAEKAARLSDAQKYADDIRQLNDTALEMVTAEADRHAGQVAELTRQLDAERSERTAAAQRYEARITELTDSLTDALTRAQALQHEAQQLHAITAAVTAPEPVQDDDLDVDQRGSDENQSEPEPRRSIWSRLFKR